MAHTSQRFRPINGSSKVQIVRRKQNLSALANAQNLLLERLATGTIFLAGKLLAQPRNGRFAAVLKLLFRMHWTLHPRKAQNCHLSA